MSPPADSAATESSRDPTEPAALAASWIYGPFGRALVPIRHWWRSRVVEDVDHTAVIAKIAAECATTPRYIFMSMMSAGIAILGMLLSSPAVVIGAMLLSPLMNPILGVGFALASGKVKWLKVSAQALLLGSLVAIGFCTLIVLFSPLRTVTEEIAARTRPNLFDLLVALFSSLAGSYAMIRGREGTIVGVAIATALMPPLAAVGYGLATLNWTVFGGALALFFTNFLTIALTATVMARLYGFRTSLSSRQGWFQNVGIFVVFVALAIPLGLSLRQIAWESNSQRIVSNAIQREFGDRSRISEQSIDWDSEPLSVSATVLTPDFRSRANEEVGSDLRERLGRDVTVTIDQFRVSADPGAAEQAEIARARAEQKAAATERQVSQLVARLALVAGVPESGVTLDRDNHRAIAQAAALPGLTLSGYRELERRAAEETPDWQIALRPPLLPFPSVALEDGAPSEAGQKALTVIVWAAKRLSLPIDIAGPPESLEPIAKTLRSQGVTLTEMPEPSMDHVEARWAAPTQ